MALVFVDRTVLGMGYQLKHTLFVVGTSIKALLGSRSCILHQLSEPFGFLGGALISEKGAGKICHACRDKWDFCTNLHNINPGGNKTF